MPIKRVQAMLLEGVAFVFFVTTFVHIGLRPPGEQASTSSLEVFTLAPARRYVDLGSPGAAVEIEALLLVMAIFSVPQRACGPTDLAVDAGRGHPCRAPGQARAARQREGCAADRAAAKPHPRPGVATPRLAGLARRRCRGSHQPIHTPQ